LRPFNVAEILETQIFRGFAVHQDVIYAGQFRQLVKPCHFFDRIVLKNLDETRWYSLERWRATAPYKGLGLSVAASWAWGTSLIVGMEIAQTKGLGAWFIWATANALTLALFGLLTKCGLLGRHVFDKLPVKAAAIVIQAFCLIIQMNIINKVIIQMGGSPMLAYWTATAIGVVFTLWMYRHGLRMSVFTDKWQWLITIVVIGEILVVGWMTGAEPVVYPASTKGDILWGIWSACILFAGPIGDVQHWQRAELNPKAYFSGAVWFGIYMLMILAMSSMQFNTLMNGLLLVAVLCVTSSTIDSIAVAMHEVSSKRTGTALALFLCVFWGVFAKIGVIELWSHAGVYRVGFAIIIIILALKETKKWKS
jgi:hypothetical protein